jgi:hypothetical protein
MLADGPSHKSFQGHHRMRSGGMADLANQSEWNWVKPTDLSGGWYTGLIARWQRDCISKRWSNKAMIKGEKVSRGSTLSVAIGTIMLSIILLSGGDCTSFGT